MSHEQHITILSLLLWPFHALLVCGSLSTRRTSPRFTGPLYLSSLRAFCFAFKLSFFPPSLQFGLFSTRNRLLGHRAPVFRKTCSRGEIFWNENSSLLFMCTWNLFFFLPLLLDIIFNVTAAIMQLVFFFCFSFLSVWLAKNTLRTSLISWCRWHSPGSLHQFNIHLMQHRRAQGFYLLVFGGQGPTMLRG